VKTGRWIVIFAQVFIILTFDACSVRLTSSEDLPVATKLLGITPYAQEPHLCGPYALAAVLQYLGNETDPVEIAERIHSPGAGGTLTMDLYLEALRRGEKVRQRKGTIKQLYTEMEAGMPAIVLLKYPGLGRSAGHFVVVSGYSIDPAGFFILWGDDRLSWMDETRFKGLWSGSGYWSLSFYGDGQS
jgi:hypothetical protein